MDNGFSPKIDLLERISPTKLNSQTGLPSMRMSRIEAPEGGDFKSVFSGLLENLNTSVNAPEQLTKDFMMDKADIHDVITAMSKSEMDINIATQMTGKIIQAYDKVMQIQI